MWSLSRAREDYAPSRIAYRLNRMWLSPVMRALVLWVLPLVVIVAGGALWLNQPQTRAVLATWWGNIETALRDQPDFQVPLMEVRGVSADLTAEIRRAVDIEFPVSMLDLPIEDIRATVLAFDAVKTVDAHVILGGPLVLTVVQREPVAVWRHAGGLELLDIEGHRVAYTDRRDGAPKLPLIAAQGAPDAVPEAMAIHAAAAPLEDRVRGLVRRGERRWDLHLTREQVIQLPETGAVQALERVLALNDAGRLLDRDVAVVDMRNPDRPTIRLGDDAFGYLRTVRSLENALMR